MVTYFFISLDYMTEYFSNLMILLNDYFSGLRLHPRKQRKLATKVQQLLLRQPRAQQAVQYPSKAAVGRLVEKEETMQLQLQLQH